MKTRLLILLLLSPLFVSAADLLPEAQKAYRDNDFQKAQSLFAEYIAAKDTDPSAADYFNLANAAVKNGNYGMAVLNYQRARRLDPSSEEIRNNLAYVESKVEDRNIISAKGTNADPHAEAPSFFSSLHDSIAVNISPDLWSWLAVGFFVLAVAGVALYFFTSSVMTRKIGFFGAGLSLFIAVVLNIFAYLGVSARNDSSRCVVIENKVKLAPEAGADASKGAELNQGTVVSILSVEDNAAGEPEWYKVRLNSDYLGWVRASEVEII